MDGKESLDSFATAPNSTVLEVLANFLQMAGQEMSTWVMQSVSTTTSDEVKKDLADEML